MTESDYRARRLKELRRRLSEKNLDALLLVNSEKLGWENLFYYSGFQGSSAIVLITACEAVLMTDSRYMTQASLQSDFELAPLQSGKEVFCIEQVLKRAEAGRCGYDGQSLRAAMYASLQALPVKWADFSDDMAEQRRHKDSHELAMIRKASDIASEAYLAALELVRPGMTELEFSKLLELEIARRGGEGVWHNSDMIVASGIRGAMPHGVASARAMERGDAVTVDYGAIFGAYMSDITRNFSLGPVRDPELLHVHDVLLAAHREAAAQLRPGCLGSDVHQTALDIITEAGYGGCFGHALGHSFGLEIHENPCLSLRYQKELQVGDVITVEPGIYIPGKGGLRLEDDYLITETGAERLTGNLPQEFVCLDL